MEQEKIQVPHDTEDDPASDPRDDHRSTIDTSRPFHSVKEAVAIFGERFLVGQIYSPTTFSFPKKETPIFSPSPRKYSSSNDGTHYISTGIMYSSPSPRGSSYNHDVTLSDIVKKLEVELEETKTELKLLKERETETEVALASLNAELHKNMSKLAHAEASEAGSKAVEASLRSGSGRGRDGDIINLNEEEKKRDGYIRNYSPSLAEILCAGENEGLFVARKKERKLVRKKKPIIPLVGDLFSWKKGSSTTLHNPLFAPSPLQWN